MILRYDFSLNILYQPLCLVVLREVWEKSRGYCQHQFRVCMTCLKYPSVGANQHFLSMQIFLGNSAMQKFLQYVNEQEDDVDILRINRISQQHVFHALHLVQIILKSLIWFPFYIRNRFSDEIMQSFEIKLIVTKKRYVFRSSMRLYKNRMLILLLQYESNTT